MGIDSSPELRKLFSVSTEEYYAEADLRLVKKLGGVLWVIGGAIAALLLVAFPPTHAIGDAGWAVVGGCFLLGTLGGARLLFMPGKVSTAELFANSLGVVVLVGILVWLTGPEAPFVGLLLLSWVYTAASQPPRRFAVYAVAGYCALFAPLVYDGWNSALAADVGLRAVIWTAMALIAMTWVGTVRKQRVALKALEAEASASARMDPLTGLGNRRAFHEAMEAEIARSVRYGPALSLIVADLDDLKTLNDSFSHMEGDLALQGAATAIRSSVRRPDACFRWGGDEFAVLLTDTDLAGASEACHRLGLRMGLLDGRPDGEPLSITCGLAEFAPGMDAAELMSAADADLVRRKHGEPPPLATSTAASATPGPPRR